MVTVSGRLTGSHPSGHARCAVNGASRVDPGRKSFRDLKEGDFVYSVSSTGRGRNKRTWATLEKVVSVWANNCTVRGGLFATLPCYSDGEPFLYFRMWYRRASGVEYANSKFEQPTDRQRIRLMLEAPEGIPLHGRPQSEKIAA